MTKNIISYVEEYGLYSFEERPFNEVDSLILCNLSYFKYDGMVPTVSENKKSVSLQHLFYTDGAGNLFRDDIYAKENRELLKKLVESRRFHSVKLNFYINILEKEWETQFSAVTFLLEDGTVYIAYRGTDVSIVGWKEDFNMAFLDPVPGQEYSRKYLNVVAEKFKVPFYVGGHSKGGNLAVYAAMTCRQEIRDRILNVYSMDGPGFRPEVLKRCFYDEIRDRIVKIMPQSSLIGMLFEREDNYRVVESKSFGILQHNLYTWVVRDGYFDYVNGIYQGRKLMDDTINEWVYSLNQDQVRIFVDTLFRVVSSTGADNVIQIATNWKKSKERMGKAIQDVDENTEQMIKKIVHSLFALLRLRLKQSVRRGEGHLKRKGPE